MADTKYAGIDYGLGRANVDKKTGIRYGVISMNSINPDCTGNFEYDYGKPSCPKCGTEVKASDDETLFADTELKDGETPDWFDHQAFTCLACETCYWSDEVYADESIGWSYNEDGYSLSNCLDNDVFVLASPFYTFAQYCSPCVPGAGNLDSPCEDGAKTFCLGHDWFDDGIAPYEVYRVSDDSEVAS